MGEFGFHKISATQSVLERMKNDFDFNHFVNACIQRFRRKDWGDVTPQDVYYIDQNLKGGSLFGRYEQPGTGMVVHIRTDQHQRIAMIMFQNEDREVEHGTYQTA